MTLKGLIIRSNSLLYKVKRASFGLIPISSLNKEPFQKLASFFF